MSPIAIAGIAPEALRQAKRRLQVVYSSTFIVGWLAKQQLDCDVWNENERRAHVIAKLQGNRNYIFGKDKN